MSPTMRAALASLLCIAAWSCTEIEPVSKVAKDAGPSSASKGESEDSGQDGSSNGGSGGTAGSSAGAAAAGSGGTTAAGAGGAGGATAGHGSTVAGSGGSTMSGSIHGRVIDYFGNPAPNVVVSVENKTAASDARGEFELPDVADVYSIGVSIEVARLEFQERTQYLFVNVTRRDPTLQVMHGYPEVGAQITRTIAGVSFPLPDSEQITLDFANPYGGFSDELVDARTTGDISWYGPQSVSGHVHALHVRRASSAATLPASYLAHGSAALTLSSGQDASFSIDLTSNAELATGTVSGSVTGDAPGAQHNAAFVRFNDQALVQIVDDTAAKASYSYLVPMLPDSSISVAAMRGEFDNPPFAVRYAEGITPGTSKLDLDIPPPVQLNAPAGGASDVNAETNFSWSGAEHVYVMFCELGGGVDDNYYVITTDKHAKLPLRPSTAPKLVPKGTYYWRISTHGELKSMDDATGPNGYMDAYSTGRLRGPKHDKGSYTLSEVRPFTASP